jgi:hypothetical protein
MKRLVIFVCFSLLACSALAQEGRVYKSLKEVTDLEAVYSLQLRGKRLKAVPAEVYEMTNLRELDLRGNRIVQLSDSIAQLMHLQRLVLSRNPLRGLPAVMAQMTELRELVLWSTYVTDLPPEFEQLDGVLELLDLRDCPMSQEDQEALEHLLPTVKKLWYYTCNCGE